jgi:hypothetical protein
MSTLYYDDFLSVSQKEKKRQARFLFVPQKTAKEKEGLDG